MASYSAPGAVTDEVTLEVDANGKLAIKDAGVSAPKMAASVRSALLISGNDYATDNHGAGPYYYPIGALISGLHATFTETLARTAMPRDGVMGGLRYRVTQAVDAGQSLTFQLRKNGVDVAGASFVVAAGSAVGTEASVAINESFVEGDDFSLESTGDGGGGGFGGKIAAYFFVEVD